MIENKFLIPEMYVQPTPKCDKCKIIVNEIEMNLCSYIEISKLKNTSTIALEETGKVIATYPPIHVLVCKQCNTEYNFKEDEITGHWVWRTI